MVRLRKRQKKQLEEGIKNGRNIEEKSSVGCKYCKNIKMGGGSKPLM